MEQSKITFKEKEVIKQINSNYIFNQLKTDYFLLNLFNILSKKKLLEIIKYNNKIKQMLNFNMNDYKEYSEKYSSIEIEIIPYKGKYGNFINIKKEDKLYYHIYFNGSKEEIKRNYLEENDKISKINIIIDYQVKSFKNLFMNCKCIEYITFKKFYRNNIESMDDMFLGC